MTDTTNPIFSCQPHNSNKAILSVYNELLKSDDQLNRRPVYQRNLVWIDGQKTGLIDSIMTNCPMPIFLLYMFEDTNECIDGQNRLSTIKEYIEQGSPTDSNSKIPFPWKVNNNGDIHYIFYPNSNIDKYIDDMNLKVKNSKSKTTTKIYRKMTASESRKFNSYQITISEIKTQLTLEQRKSIFMRWQSGTGISQCDKYKNENNKFCDYLRMNSLESQLVPKIETILKSGRKNWLFDVFRLLKLFSEKDIQEKDVFLSTIKARSQIDNNIITDDSEILSNAVKRCIKFLQKMSHLKMSKISFLLAYAFIWKDANEKDREIMENEEFSKNFMELSLTNIEHSTLNNGPQETEFVKAFPLFKIDLDKEISKKIPNDPTAFSRKKTIPATLKTDIWNYWIGPQIGESKCLCCGTKPIRQREFEAGHVKAESHGGTTDIVNLRPICGQCNKSMGTQHMVAFMERYFPSMKLTLPPQPNLLPNNLIRK